MKKIAFIGIGVMGLPMATHLLNAGHDISVYSRTKEKALPIIEKGAKWADNIKDCIADSDYIITMVGFPKDVSEVYFSDNGIIENAKDGAYLIDFTTTEPSLAQKIYNLATTKSLHSLDAPVSGGDKGAREQTLSIMVGGDVEEFEHCRFIFEILGKQLVYTGKAGNGQHTKMANQIAIAGTLAAVCEAITYAKRTGLDPETCISAISKGAAGSWQMINQSTKILNNDKSPGFYIKHFIKDLKIAQSEAQATDLSLPIMNKVITMLEELSAKGYDDYGTQALIDYYN